MLSFTKLFSFNPVHWVWEVLPLVHFATQFIKDNPDVRVLVPGGLPKKYLKLVWGDALAPGQLVTVGKEDRWVAL